MAQTAHGLCNAALVLAGHSGIVSSDFLTVQVDETERKCAIIYEYQRDKLLRAYDWKFATRRAILSNTGRQNVGTSDYTYGYSLPSGYLKMVRVISPDGVDWENGLIVTGETGALYFLSNETDGSDIEIAYLSQVTDPVRFDTSFFDALVCKLGSIFAIAIAENVQKSVVLKQDFKDSIAEAKRLNAFEEAQHLREERSYNETDYVKWIDAGE